MSGLSQQLGYLGKGAEEMVKTSRAVPWKTCGGPRIGSQRCLL